MSTSSLINPLVHQLLQLIKICFKRSGWISFRLTKEHTPHICIGIYFFIAAIDYSVLEFNDPIGYLLGWEGKQSIKFKARAIKSCRGRKIILPLQMSAVTFHFLCGGFNSILCITPALTLAKVWFIWVCFKVRRDYRMTTFMTISRPRYQCFNVMNRR